MTLYHPLAATIPVLSADDRARMVEAMVGDLLEGGLDPDTVRVRNRAWAEKAFAIYIGAGAVDIARDGVVDHVRSALLTEVCRSILTRSAQADAR